MCYHYNKILISLQKFYCCYVTTGRNGERACDDARGLRPSCPHQKFGRGQQQAVAEKIEEEQEVSVSGRCQIKKTASKRNPVFPCSNSPFAIFSCC